MTLFKEVADIKTSDQLHLPVPEAVYHNVVAQPTEIQQAMVQELSERAAKVHAGAVDASVDNMLRITTDGRKLGLDQRIINPDLPDDPSSKVNMCVDNIYRIWDEGQADRLTQLVFCDLSTPKTGAPAAKAAKAVGGNLDNPELHAVAGAVKDDPPEPEFTVYDDIREKLVARGIPREQIAFIHEANTEARKKELFAKVRSGQVRVLMGSTFKMGAGMNVQDRLVALHDLDAPWRPGDLEQREGRINRFKCLAIRQNVADKYGKAVGMEFKRDIWEEMFEAAKAEKQDDQSELVPFWCFGENQSVKIERLVPMYPMSKDEVNYERLIKILSLYRLTLGQARQEELLEYLFKEFKDTSGLKELFIDLSPFSKGKEG